MSFESQKVQNQVGLRTAVFSDVHGNLPALEAMVREAGDVDRFLCLGDVVNYGPWSNECVERVAALPNCISLLGNHDSAFLSGIYPGTNFVARAFFDFCYPRFSRHELLQNYRLETGVGGFRAVHTLGDHYIFVDTPIALDHSYIIGHSHHQFERTVGPHRLVNAGSVGQNRRDLRVCQFLIHGPGENQVELRSCDYDWPSLMRKMEELSYPEICLAYYRSKLPSQDKGLP